MEMSWIPMVGYAALALLVLGWLSVSFMAPGARRAIVEWSSDTTSETELRRVSGECEAYRVGLTAAW